LMDSTMQLSFPNFQFIMTFILMIATSLVIGLFVRRFINKTANGNKVLKTNLIMLFVIGTVFSLVVLMGAYMLV
jgi:high-affinity Fe2+/Pb2+ permease